MSELLRGAVTHLSGLEEPTPPPMNLHRGDRNSPSPEHKYQYSTDTSCRAKSDDRKAINYVEDQSGFHFYAKYERQCWPATVDPRGPKGVSAERDFRQ